VGDSDETLDALFRQAGVLRARSLAEMLGLARVLAAQPLPRARRVAVLSNVGGPAILSNSRSRKSDSVVSASAANCSRRW
jgi:acyl-CoA synthetase (NDP forming)